MKIRVEHKKEHELLDTFLNAIPLNGYVVNEKRNGELCWTRTMDKESFNHQFQEVK